MVAKFRTEKKRVNKLARLTNISTRTPNIIANKKSTARCVILKIADSSIVGIKSVLFVYLFGYKYLSAAVISYFAALVGECVIKRKRSINFKLRSLQGREEPGVLLLALKPPGAARTKHLCLVLVSSK